MADPERFDANPDHTFYTEADADPNLLFHFYSNTLSFKKIVWRKKWKTFLMKTFKYFVKFSKLIFSFNIFKKAR